MDHYLEIRVLPDPEFSSEMLMAALFAKLHRALGARGQGVTNGAIVIHTQRLKSDPGGNLLS